MSGTENTHSLAADGLLASLQTVVAQQATILQGQQQMLARQDARLDAIQEQLGMLTEVATKLAVMEERRGEDKQALSKLDDRFTAVEKLVIANFPKYNDLVDTYKNLNNKLWSAIGIGVIGVILGAAKMGWLVSK
jgi:hypothetical protein